MNAVPGGGGGNSHTKRAGTLVVSLRGAKRNHVAMKVSFRVAPFFLHVGENIRSLSSLKVTVFFYFSVFSCALFLGMQCLSNADCRLQAAARRACLKHEMAK